MGRHYLAVQFKRSGTASAYTAHIVVRQRRRAEPVVLEVVFDRRMLAGGQGLRSFPAGPLEVGPYSADSAADIGLASNEGTLALWSEITLIV